MSWAANGTGTDDIADAVRQARRRQGAVGERWQIADSGMLQRPDVVHPHGGGKNGESDIQPIDHSAKSGAMDDAVGCFEHHPQDSRVTPTDISPTLGVYGNALEGKDMLITGEVDALCFQQNQRNEVRLICEDGSVAGCLNAESGMKNTNYISENNTEENQNMPKLPRMTVRRLLPQECERLFGLPDGHTIPCFKPEDITDELVERFIEIFFIWDCFCQSLKKQGTKADEPLEEDVADDTENDGEVANETQISDAEELADDGEATEEPTETEPTSDGDVPKLPKKRSAKWIRAWLEKVSNPETCPDAPRYKACGNSFGVNCVRWIGLGIEAVERQINGKNK